MATNYNPRIVTDGLVLCLDAGNTKSYPGPVPVAGWYDLSGNGNNGTFAAASAPTYDSANGGSLVFDGENDYVSSSAGISSPISFGQGKSFTIELVFETNDYGASQALIARRNTDSSGDSDYMIFYQSSDFTFGTGSSGDSGAWRVVGSAFNTNNQIMHFCGVIDSTGAQTGTKITYKNGVQIDSISYAAKASATANSTFIGKYNGNGFYLNGKIYNVKIYNRTLTAAEVQQNFNATRSRYGIEILKKELCTNNATSQSFHSQR